MEKQENLSQSKYAEHRNVTKGYIGRLVKEGRFTTSDILQLVTFWITGTL